MNQLIHVIYVVNGTTKNAWFEAEHCSSQILDGSGILEFTNGHRVEEGWNWGPYCAVLDMYTPVTSVQYANCEVIEKFPIKDDATKPDNG